MRCNLIKCSKRLSYLHLKILLVCFNFHNLEKFRKADVSCPQDTLLKDRQRRLVFYPSNQNTLYLLHLFYSDNEIITVHRRPTIFTLIGWIEISSLFLSFNKVSWREFKQQVFMYNCVSGRCAKII